MAPSLQRIRSVSGIAISIGVVRAIAIVCVAMSGLGAVAQTPIPELDSFDFVETEVATAQSYSTPMNHPLVMAEAPIERFRRGFYQGAEVSAGHLFDIGSGSSEARSLDQTFQEIRMGFGVPLGSLDHILAVQPYFRVDQLSGPTSLDVPPTLYDTGVAFFNAEKWTETISTTIVVTPSIRSDMTTGENAFRLFGLGLVNWQASDAWRWSFGVLYLDRADLGVLPVAGATWTPTPDWRIEMTLPRPRIARRLWLQPGAAEGWAYFAGEFGGNTWAFTRTDGVHDEVTLSHFRVLAGYETNVAGNRGIQVEGGYSFGRSVEFELAEVDVDLNNAFFLQAGWRF